MVFKSVWCIWFISLLCGVAQTESSPTTVGGLGRPAIIATVALVEFETLPLDRRTLIEIALAVARDSHWLVYTAGGAKPTDGGFDCSGAMHFVMRAAGLDPPRRAATQLEWLKHHDRFNEVPSEVMNMQHPTLAGLISGDLLFWGRQGSSETGDQGEVTHVAMFLGTERTDGQRVMINSTVGRSYHGIKANGYGVYDFRLPPKGSRISFLGYGSPPGIAEIPKR